METYTNYVGTSVVIRLTTLQSAAFTRMLSCNYINKQNHNRNENSLTGHWRAVNHEDNAPPTAGSTTLLGQVNTQVARDGCRHRCHFKVTYCRG